MYEIRRVFFAFIFGMSWRIPIPHPVLDRERRDRGSRVFVVVGGGEGTRGIQGPFFSPPPSLLLFLGYNFRLILPFPLLLPSLLLHENERDLLGKQMRAHRGRERKGLFFLFPPEGLVQEGKGQRELFSICFSKSKMQCQ